MSQLHACPRCSAPFVVPAEVLAVRPGALCYVMELECNNCGWRRYGTFTEDEMQALDADLDEAQAEIAADAEVLWWVRWEEDIARFRHALENDLILPEDF